MSAAKPHLKTVDGQVVQVDQRTRESPIEAARRRYGKPFAFERGVPFTWKSGPTVLTNWLAKKIAEREKDES